MSNLTDILARTKALEKKCDPLHILVRVHCPLKLQIGEDVPNGSCPA